jgi:competence protein ComEA
MKMVGGYQKPVFLYRIVTIFMAVILSIALFCNERIQKSKISNKAFSHVSSQLIVKVSGDVKTPGLYDLPANSMAGSAILLANDLLHSNSLIKTDNYKLLVATGSEINVTESRLDNPVIKIGMMPVKQRLVMGMLFDINKMDAAELALLPGIGPGLAENIIRRRQYVGGTMGCQELENISGIGHRKYLQLINYFNCH